jgi:undecaprenyl diphosphate synthase
MPDAVDLKPELREYVQPGSAEEEILRAVDLARLPRHVAVIMDGNGRWAARRDLPRVEGHRAGIDAVREIVEACARMGIEVLTLYAFSKENWKRPRAEVDTLMSLLREYLHEELPYLKERGIRFRTIGKPSDLPQLVQDDLEDAAEQTGPNRAMIFNVALSYGSRQEILDACNTLVGQALTGDLVLPVTERAFDAALYTAGLPDPDLVIRTSGENRISNFLLWQAAYAEFWTTDVLWPDFRRGDLFRAVRDYQQRERRYGGV